MQRTPLLILFLFCTAVLHAQPLRVAPYICDSMVLQRDLPLTICGEAAPGSQIELSFAGQNTSAQADDTGRWHAELPPLEASCENRTMEIRSGQEKLEIRAVLVGEVWLAGGQSNMGFKVAGMEAQERLALAREAHDPALRYYYRANIVSGGKLLNAKDRPWSGAYGRKIYDWSAVAYLFAKELYKSSGIPVGIVNCSHGGSTAEAWISPGAFAADKALEASIGKTYGGIDVYYKNPSVLYIAMLEQFRGLTVRGVIWYQGESNGYFPDKYRTLFSGLIADWRRLLGNEELPFIFAQLPSYRVPGDKSGERWSWLRQAQLEVAQSAAHTSLVVTADCGDPENIHPKNKYPIGMRFAAAARSGIYGDKVVGALTVPTNASVRGGEVLIPVGGIRNGLELRGKESGFELRGKDGAWHPAQLRIRGSQLTIGAKEVPDPSAVRYAWGNINRLTVYHKSGLPLPPFILELHPENQ